MNEFLKFAPAYMVLGIIIHLLGCGIRRIDSDIKKRCTRPATGYILDNQTQAENGKTKYHPLVTYEIDGTNYTILYKEGTKESIYTLGQIVPIRINPNNHSEIIIVTDKVNAYDKLGRGLMVAGLVVFATAALTAACMRIFA